MLQAPIIINTQPSGTDFIFLPYILGLLATVIVLWVLFLIARLFLKREPKLKIFLLTVPKYDSLSQAENEAAQHIKEQLSHVENLFAALGALRAEGGWKAWLFGRQDYFALEIVARQGEISFYCGVSEPQVEFFIHVLQSVHPNVHYQEVADYNIFPPQGFVACSYLKLSRDVMFPIKTYQLFDFDPLETLTNVLSKLETGESLVIQYIIRSAHRVWHQRGVKTAKALNSGKGLKEAMAGQSSQQSMVGKGLSSVFSTVLTTTRSQSEKPKPGEQPKEPKVASQLEIQMAKALEEKANKAGLDVNIRLISVSTNKVHVDANLRGLINAYGQFNIYETGNSFRAKQLHSRDRLIKDFIYRRFDQSALCLFNAEEMVGLWHLPGATIATPNIRWLEARSAPPPRDLPTRGLLLGHSVYRGQSFPVRMKDEDRRRHTYIIGQTGTGKTVLMGNLMLQDIQAGKGCCLIDPHGDLVEALLGLIPPDREKDVIVFDPSDTSRPMGLNMLEFFNADQKTLVINEMINIFDKLYDLKKTGGPIFEQYMRNTLLLMMEDVESGCSLMEVAKVLADENFRKYKLSKATNPVVRDFWLKEAHKAGGEASLANMVPYITSKLTQFTANDIMRPIIAQQTSSFNFRDIMDQRKILLVNLSKGKIGELNSNLLGLIIVGKILIAALSRVDTAEEERADFYLYIDEFQNFLTDSIAVILSEARKYRLNLTMAHQYISQLVRDGDTKIRDAVFGNVGTKIAFRIGAEDAETLKKEFTPVFSDYDLLNISKNNAYIKLLIDNQNPPAFNIKLEPPKKGDPQIATRLKEQSRIQYGRPREEVEQEIIKRSGMIVS
jgi:hypothetical protein